MLRSQRLVRRALGAGALVALACSVSAAPASATDASLPGGTSISSTIASLTVEDGGLHLTGAASVATAAQQAPSTGLVLTLDLSGSESQLVAAGACPDANGDGAADTRLDCEVAAAAKTTQQARDAGTIAELGVVGFAGRSSSASSRGYALADVSPARDQQDVTGPSTDDDADGTSDVDQVLRSAVVTTSPVASGFNTFTPVRVDAGTHYEEAIKGSLAAAAVMTSPRKLVLLMSDGAANGGRARDQFSSIPADVTINTFAIGPDAVCGDLGRADGNSLRAIAEAGHGTCTEVPDLGQLPTVVPQAVGSSLQEITFTIDDGASHLLSPSVVLPHAGPVEATYDETVPTAGLAPGQHTFCAVAAGSDAGGAGQAEDCQRFTIAAAPTDPDPVPAVPEAPQPWMLVLPTLGLAAFGGVVLRRRS